MKKLILVRHAKSSWEHDVIDHQRPLNERGLNDAHMVSKNLSLESQPIDLVISSDSNRTKTTAGIFISNLDIDEGLVQFSHDVYDFSGEKLIQVIKNCNDRIKNLMIFGHNHAITAFVNTFGTKDIENVPTSGVVIIEFEIEKWSSLKPGRTIKILFPRDLKL